MPDFLQTHSENWIKYFHSHGYVDVIPLAAGVEGAVYDLGHNLIAKVWAKKSHKEISLMQAFYVDVANASLPFETPEIIEIRSVEETSVTIERKLQGQSLQCYLSPNAPQPDNKAVECVITVLNNLQKVRATKSMRSMSVLDEKNSFYDDSLSFGKALIALLKRRFCTSSALLCECVIDCNNKFEQLLERIRTIDVMPIESVIHGDLFPENILVDRRGRLAAVLDFGFMSPELCTGQRIG